MKKLILLMAACALLTGAYGEGEGVPVEGYPWTTEVHPDWATFLDGKAGFTIPADTAYVVSGETEMTVLNDWINGLASVWGNIKFGNANSALILDNTTSWFAKSNIMQLFVPGWLVKRGVSTLVNAGATFYNFYGDWMVEGGVFKEDTNYWNAPNQGRKIVVKSGGTFQKGFSCPGGNTEIVLEGTGSEGQGALVLDKCNNNGMLPRVTLAGDALVALNVDGTFFDRYIPETSPGQYKVGVDPAELNLNGHKLTLGGTAATIGFRKVDVSSEGGAGIIEVAALAAGGARTLTLANAVRIPANVTVVTKGDADIQYNASTLLDEPPAAAIVAEGNLTFRTGADIQADGSCTWAGDVSIADGKTLTVRSSVEAVRLTFTGAFGGDGSLQFGSADAASSGAALFLGSNSLAGATTVYGGSSGAAYFRYPNANLSVVSGKAYPRPILVEGVPTWSEDDLLAFGKANGGTPLVLDGSELTSAADYVFDVETVSKYYPALDCVWNGVKDGPGFTLEGPYDDAAKPLSLNVSVGTVRVTGEGTIILGTSDAAVAGVVSGVSADSCGTVVFDGAKDVVYGDQKFVIGHVSTSVKATLPRVIVTNSTIRSTCENFNSDIFKGAFFVGHKSAGILEIEEGAVVSNKLVVGGGNSANEGYGCGAVYQRGGLVTPTTHVPADNSVYKSSVGGAGLGYYALEGGEFRPTGTFPVAVYARGTFLQTGGLAWFNGMSVSSWNGDGVYTVLGGTTVVSNGQFLCLGGPVGSSVVTVQGEGSVFDSSRALYSRTYCFGSLGGSPRATFNFNDGGTYKLGGFLVTYESTQDYPLIVNFNGGRLHLSGANTTPFSWQSSDAKSVMAPEVAVYERGAVFSVDAGKSVKTEPSVLCAHKTGGIKAIRLPAAGLANCPAAPLVQIKSSTGYGASAIALVDSRTCSVTNILVTSCGWGYEAGSTTVELGLAPWTSALYTVPAANIEIDDNDVGGLTMEGPGTLTVSLAGNQWEKWTKVVGGTLVAGVEDSIPSGTVLTLSNGATLDLNNTAPTFSGLAGNGGTVANGALVMEDGMTVSAKKFIDRETTEVNGTIDLSGVSNIVLTDTECLDEAAKQLRGFWLFKATNIILPEEGEIEVTGVPADFHARLTESGLFFGPDRGSLLIIR